MKQDMGGQVISLVFLELGNPKANQAVPTDLSPAVPGVRTLRLGP